MDILLKSYTNPIDRNKGSLQPLLKKIIFENSEDDEEVIDLRFIINNKPKTRIVREYMKTQLLAIQNEEDEIFLPTSINENE